MKVPEEAVHAEEVMDLWVKKKGLSVQSALKSCTFLWAHIVANLEKQEERAHAAGNFIHSAMLFENMVMGAPRESFPLWLMYILEHSLGEVDEQHQRAMVLNLYTDLVMDKSEEERSKEYRKFMATVERACIAAKSVD